MTLRYTLALLPPLALLGCETQQPPVLASLPPVSGEAGQAAPRVSGPIGKADTGGTALVTYGTVRPSAAARAEAAGSAGPEAGDVSLDFVDTDLREIVAQVLGTVLKVNYTIDPAVRGTATLRTVNPVPRSRVLAALQAVLAQNNATVFESGGLYRVAPAANAAASPGAGGPGIAGSAVVPLRYASADDLAKVLQPYAGATGRVSPDTGRNALLISGDPTTREALLNLVHAFDIDVLAGQSYALFPVGSGSAKDFGTALSDALRSGQGGALAGVVRVVPMERINAVLLVSAQSRYIDDARRVYSLVERARRQTVRGWSVFYLQNSKSNDVAYVLQQAFTPNRVTATPSARAAGTQARRNGNTTNSFNSGGSGLGSVGGRSGSSGGSGSSGLGGGGLGGGGLGDAGSQPAPGQNPANPLLGGLDSTPSPAGSSGAAAGGDTDLNTIRIIPNAENNAILLYATPAEHDTIEAMLHKIDILPLQVRIDAVIAEVSLNDNLNYGTQFFFKGGGINGALNLNSMATLATQGALASAFPGFVLNGGTNETYALSALQNVTTVKVLSSPQLMVLDNEAARLQVGNLVPYLTSSSQSQLTNNANIVNSIDYRETGVIMEVTPRVNSGGLVTLDISQEVSDVDNSATASSPIPSPTFLQRNVKSRVVVQDGQTIGLAGLIRDNSSRGNSGIPWLKDVPVLGFLAGQQTNSRNRTELLVLITPHVVHDQRDARALTEDLRDQLINAAAVPSELGRLGPSGSVDPQRRVRRGIGLER